MVTVQRSVWHEQRPADAPPIGLLDWLLVGVVAAAALVEGIARPEGGWVVEAVLPVEAWDEHPCGA